MLSIPYCLAKPADVRDDFTPHLSTHKETSPGLPSHLLLPGEWEAFLWQITEICMQNRYYGFLQYTEKPAIKRVPQNCPFTKVVFLCCLSCFFYPPCFLEIGRTMLPVRWQRLKQKLVWTKESNKLESESFVPKCFVCLNWARTSCSRHHNQC